MFCCLCVCIFAMGEVVGEDISIVSAVPAGDVMLLGDVFGIVKPAAAIIGTMIIVVLFPGTPPEQCLSIIG